MGMKDEENKELLDIAMEELEKESNIYFIDEIGERLMFSKEL